MAGVPYDVITNSTYDRRFYSTDWIKTGAGCPSIRFEFCTGAVRISSIYGAKSGMGVT